MTVSSLVGICRAVLDDQATTKFWADADLVSFIDAAQKFFVSIAPDDAVPEFQKASLTTLTAAATGATVGATSLPSDFYQFRLARTRQTTGGTLFTARLMKLEELYAMERSEIVEKATDRNPAVAVWANSIYCTPVSTGNVGSGIQLFYLTTVTDITTITSTSPQINGIHQPMLAEWALYLAFEKFDPARAQLHRENFLNYIQAIGGRWTDRSRALPAERRIAERDAA